MIDQMTSKVLVQPMKIGSMLLEEFEQFYSILDLNFSPDQDLPCTHPSNLKKTLQSNSSIVQSNTDGSNKAKQNSGVLLPKPKTTSKVSKAKSSDLFKYMKVVVSGAKRWYKCKICKLSYSTKSHLKDHIVFSHKGRKDFECELCRKIFFTNSMLTNHTKTVHEGEKNFECSICEKRFIQKGSLNSHLKSVHNITNETRKPKEEINYKEVVVNGARRYKCTICKKTYSTKSHLKDHIIFIHEGKKDFKCNLCSTTTFTNSLLKNHIRTVHKGEKKFKCRVCKKSFSQKGNLKKHLENVHNKKLIKKRRKDFQCTICKKWCTTKNNLNIHISFVHEKNSKTFSCDLCNTSTTIFRTNSMLKNHIRTVHQEEMRFQCDVCKKSFILKRNLKIHLAKVHKVTTNPNVSSKIEI